VGIRCADHETPSIRKSWHTSPTSGGWVGIVRLRAKATEFYDAELGTGFNCPGIGSRDGLWWAFRWLKWKRISWPFGQLKRNSVPWNLMYGDSDLFTCRRCYTAETLGGSTKNASHHLSSVVEQPALCDTRICAFSGGRCSRIRAWLSVCFKRVTEKLTFRSSSADLRFPPQFSDSMQILCVVYA
jgi:hypothetical protein